MNTHPKGKLHRHSIIYILLGDGDINIRFSFKMKTYIS